eukprot:13958534-Heterocapsa_arctica.AAC.1
MPAARACARTHEPTSPGPTGPEQSNSTPISTVAQPGKGGNKSSALGRLHTTLCAHTKHTARR